MPKLKGGELEKSCSSDITFEGRPLEEVLAEEEGKEMGEVLASDKISIYRKSGDGFTTHAEGHGPGKIWTRREVNKHTWEKMLMDSNTIDNAIIAVLLSGGEVSGSVIRDRVLTSLPGVTNKKYAQRMNYLMTKTDLGKVIERRQEGKGKAYKLVTAALDCRPEELATFAYKSKARDKVLAHHKALKPYLQADESEAKPEPDPKSKVDLGLLTPPNGPITAALETALSESLGVNVTVSGCIEIKFTFGN
jgi:hypothetical protein